MTKQKLSTILAETGHALTLDDVDIIQELDRAADVVVKGAQVPDVSLFAYPLYVAGEAFYAPTIGKEIFWREQVVDVIGDDMLAAAFLWILTLEDVPDCRGRDITKAVKKWAKHCKITAADSDYIQKRYVSEEESETTNKNRANYGEVLALLVREYGQDCMHWLNAPESEVKLLLADWTARQESKAAAYRKSSAGSKNQVAPAPSPKIVALTAFNKIVIRIAEDWKNTDG